MPNWWKPDRTVAEQTKGVPDFWFEWQCEHCQSITRTLAPGREIFVVPICRACWMRHKRRNRCLTGWMARDGVSLTLDRVAHPRAALVALTKPKYSAGKWAASIAMVRAALAAVIVRLHSGEDSGKCSLCIKDCTHPVGKCECMCHELREFLLWIGEGEGLNAA